MKALQLTESGEDTIIFATINKPTPGEDEVLVRLKAAALNHRDQWCREGKYPGLKTGTTLGSDGAGIVEEVGDNVDEMWLGKEVVINPNIAWGDNPAVQSSDYHILGMPTDGTFAEYVKVKSDRLVGKPGHLSFEETAALPIGGMTAYRALFTQAKVQQGDRVLVTGIGGGVSQFAALFLKASGISYYVTSGSDEKIAEAIKAGAEGGFNYKSEGWAKQAIKESGQFDVIIDSAGGDLVNTYLKLIKPAGRIVFYGSTAGTPKSLDLFRIFWSQTSLLG
ncbi:MAG: zinc-binding dehydrogenase, partial [Cyclobacteriaceae bacterium]